MTSSMSALLEWYAMAAEEGDVPARIPHRVQSGCRAVHCRDRGGAPVRSQANTWVRVAEGATKAPV